MKKILCLFVLWGAILAVASLCYAQDATYQTNVYTDNSGDRLNVKSGGSITVWSGGDIDLKSGASLYYNATKILGATTYLPVASGGTGSNTAAGARDNLGMVGGEVSIGATGSATVATGLTTVSYALAGINVLDADHGQVAISKSAGDITLTMYALGTTTVSTSAGTATYFAVGTP